MTTLLPRLTDIDRSLAHCTLALVGGQGKSGTTWVERLIDAHPQAACLGEGHFAEGLGRLLYRALDEYNQLLADNNRRFPELEDFPGIDADDAGELVRAALLLQFAAIARRKPGAGTVAVRTPSELNWLAELQRAFPQARFVHVIRDPRDVAVSVWWHRERLEPGRLALAHGSPTGLAQTLVPGWAKHIESVRAAARKCDAALHEIRYEDLQQQPEASAAALFGFLGLPAGPQMCRNSLDQASFSRLSGRPAGQNDPASHFRQGTSGQWRDTMSAAPPQGWPEPVQATLESLAYPID
ncbi:MAG: sulfotransferase [Xanthomonadales bacterium]|nr:sulfotransferase [Xanthomonadales bacterium]